MDEDEGMSGPVRSHANETDIWPLRLIDFDDSEQCDIVFKMLGALPEAIHFYLREFIFPPTLRHQGMKLSASGQETRNGSARGSMPR